MNSCLVQAPAKINLGLEILGRRSDGFHEILTVMAMLEIADTLVFFIDETESNGHVEGVRPEDNLVRRGLDAFRRSSPGSPPIGWTIEKRIPAAAGLGGASSDAAAALFAANHLAGHTCSQVELTAIASTLGSDIPFFLGQPVALASGRGTDLSSLPGIDEDVLLIVPPTSLGAKTTAMYGSLQPEDFSDGAQTMSLVEQLQNGERPTSDLLRNAFSRAVSIESPVLDIALEVISETDNCLVALSGAGPACYVLSSRTEHERIKGQLSDLLPLGTSFISTSTRRVPLTIQPEVICDVPAR